MVVARRRFVASLCRSVLSCADVLVAAFSSKDIRCIASAFANFKMASTSLNQQDSFYFWQSFIISFGVFRGCLTSSGRKFRSVGSFRTFAKESVDVADFALNWLANWYRLNNEMSKILKNCHKKEKCCNGIVDQLVQKWSLTVNVTNDLIISEQYSRDFLELIGISIFLLFLRINWHFIQWLRKNANFYGIFITSIQFHLLWLLKWKFDSYNFDVHKWTKTKIIVLILTLNRTNLPQINFRNWINIYFCCDFCKFWNNTQKILFYNINLFTKFI